MDERELSAAYTGRLEYPAAAPEQPVWERVTFTGDFTEIPKGTTSTFDLAESGPLQLAFGKLGEDNEPLRQSIAVLVPPPEMFPTHVQGFLNNLRRKPEPEGSLSYVTLLAFIPSKIKPFVLGYLRLYDRESFTIGRQLNHEMLEPSFYVAVHACTTASREHAGIGFVEHEGSRHLAVQNYTPTYGTYVRTGKAAKHSAVETGETDSTSAAVRTGDVQSDQANMPGKAGLDRIKDMLRR